MGKKKTERLPVRQGDVLLVPVDDQGYFTRNYVKPVKREKGEGIVVAAGEATGHHHRIRSRHARKYQGRGRTFVRVHRSKEPVLLTHEEHLPIELSPGLWEYVAQREYEAPGKTRRVYD